MERNVVKLNETQREILELIQEDNKISANALAKKLSISSRAVEKNIKLLKSQGILIRHGAPKGGHWEVN